MRRRVGLLAVALVMGTVVGAIGPGVVGSAAAPGDVVVLAAGDIAGCSSKGDSATAALLGTLNGTVLTLGDNAYDYGTTTEFTNCFGPTWGVYKARIRPAPGNHDYGTAGAAGYFGYFGSAAGSPARGYYSFNLGAWRIYSLNSNCSAAGGCGLTSAQGNWLRDDLAANPHQCVLAYWHHPRFSSGYHGSSTAVRPLWRILFDAHAEVVLAGHDHDYERFAAQNAAGVATSAGIREFVVGTGGRSHYAFPGAPIANSQVRNASTFGVLKLTLSAGSYSWRFMPVAGKTFTDSGSASCH